MSEQKFYVRHGSDGAYLANFDMIWFTQHGDDPSCWSDDIKHAKTYTIKRIARMRPLLEGFQGPFTMDLA